MESILAHWEKRRVSVKITVINVEGKDMIIKNDIWLGGRLHQVDHLTEISPNT